MREIRGDLFQESSESNGIVVITTNGDINSRGECVMGRGVALQAKKIYPQLPRMLAKCIKLGGNRVYYHHPALVTMPVKHHWNEQADLDLIRLSCQQLFRLGQFFPWATFYLPRPGCGNGGLQWDDVRKTVQFALMGDRFVVVEKYKP